MAEAARIKNHIFYLFPLIAFITGILPQESSNPWMLLPFALLSVCLVLSGRLADLQLKDPVLLCLLLLWLGWSWGGIFSAVPFASQVTWVTLGIFPVAYLYSVNRDITPLLYAVCFCVTLLAAAAIYQMFFLPHYWRARLFFQDENLLGSLMAFVLPLMTSFCFTAGDKNRKRLIFLGIVLLTGGLFLTQSRSAFIGAAVGVLAVLIKNRQTLSRQHLKFAVPLVLFALAGIGMSGLGGRLVMAVGLDKDVLGRLALYKAAFQMSHNHPVHGVGLGVFHLYYPPYKTLADNSSGFWVHMDPLQWIVETGWFTGLAVYALSACVAFRYFKENLTSLQIGAGASLLVIFVIAHACYVFHYVPIALLAGLLLSRFGKTGNELPPVRYALAVPLTIVILGGIGLVIKVTPTLYLWTRGVEALNTKNIPVFVDAMKQCIERGDPRFSGCRIEAGKFLIQTSPDPDPQALVWLREAEAYDDRESAIPVLRAQYYLKRYPENPALPERELNRALEIDPSSWPARKSLVELLMKQDKYAQALDTLGIARKYRIDGQFLQEFYDMETKLTKKVKP